MYAYKMEGNIIKCKYWYYVWMIWLQMIFVSFFILLCIFYILCNGNVLPYNKKKSYFMRLIQDKKLF